MVRHFYQALIHPEPEFYGEPDYRRVEQLLGADLLAALVAQDNYEAACAALVPADIKPYMLDQSPFFLAPDGARSLARVRTRIYGDVARVIAALAYGEAQWEDVATLVRESGRWKIVNIAWGGGGSVTERLTGFAAYRCAPNNSSKPTPLRGAA